MNPPLDILLANKDKFFARLRPSPAPPGVEGPCLIWMSTRDKDDYGVFQFRHKGEKFQKPAHIAAYVIAKGCEPRKMLLHQCHRRPCCNVQHTVRGGHRTNMAEMVAAGRAAVGSANAQSKLVERDVFEILRLLATGLPKVLVAQMFDVNRSTIAGIENGTLWKHVPRPLGFVSPKPYVRRATSAGRMAQILKRTQM
jgi:hypothetical protein